MEKTHCWNSSSIFDKQNKQYQTVGTVQTFDKQNKQYHTVGTVP